MGTCTLTTPDDSHVVIERDRFPTNAKKDYKIKANKSAKFTKIVARLKTALHAAGVSKGPAEADSDEGGDAD
jgi:hypothetical protein